DREELAQTYLDTEIVVPFYLIEEDTRLDLGGREVHLLYGGRGHTDHDLVVSVPDAGVVFWGDLIEQGADPAMEYAFPLECADTVQRILEKVPDHTIAVPGHGDVVDQAYVIAQQEQLAQLAATLE